MWETDPKKLNICKLFWGTLLFPLSAIAYKSFGGFAIRIAISYAVVSVVFAIFSLLDTAIIFFGASLMFAAMSALYFHYNKGKVEVDSKAAKDQTLTKISGNRSVVLEWVLEHTLGYALDAYWRITDSNKVHRLKGPLGVVFEYMRSAKHRLCPLIKVE